MSRDLNSSHERGRSLAGKSESWARRIRSGRGNLESRRARTNRDLSVNFLDSLVSDIYSPGWKRQLRRGQARFHTRKGLGMCMGSRRKRVSSSLGGTESDRSRLLPVAWQKCPAPSVLQVFVRLSRLFRSYLFRSRDALCIPPVVWAIEQRPYTRATVNLQNLGETLLNNLPVVS